MTVYADGEIQLINESKKPLTYNYYFDYESARAFLPADAIGARDRVEGSSRPQQGRPVTLVIGENEYVTDFAHKVHTKVPSTVHPRKRKDVFLLLRQTYGDLKKGDKLRLFPIDIASRKFGIDVVGKAPVKLTASPKPDYQKKYSEELSNVVADIKLPPGKEKDALIKRRIGQGAFRSFLINEFGSKCAVTGLEEVSLLRASHIIPWSKLRESPEQQTDVNNGILLSVTWDALFDNGLITFDSDTGKVIICKAIDNDSILSKLGIMRTASLNPVYLTPARQEYLRRHRAEEFVDAI